MTFGDKLRELRLSKGLTQTELAEQVGCKQSSLTDWEAGRFVPTFEIVHRICKALGENCTAFDGCKFEEVKKKREPGRPKKDQ